MDHAKLPIHVELDRAFLKRRMRSIQQWLEILDSALLRARDPKLRGLIRNRIAEAELVLAKVVWTLRHR